MIDKLINEIELNGMDRKESIDVIKDFFKFKDERYEQMDFKLNEYNLCGSRQNIISNNYAYRKVADKYQL